MLVSPASHLRRLRLPRHGRPDTIRAGPSERAGGGRHLWTPARARRSTS